MWARDFLPDTLEDSSLGSGRYLTFGYPTPFIDSDQITQSIQDTAGNLLRQIVEERGPDCKRPIFFVCHSLGGLVVAQAVLQILEDHQDGSELSKLRNALCPSSYCLVKGITFFGTPFCGSSLANLLAGISKYLRLPINRTHISYLRIRDKDVASIVDKFEERTKQMNIPLLVFYELKPEKIGLFKHLVVKRDSAQGRFGEQVQKIGLLASHRDMARFKSGQDRIYEKIVGPAMQSFTRNALGEHKRQAILPRKLTQLANLPLFASHPQQASRIMTLPMLDGDQIETRKNQVIIEGRLDFEQHNIVSDARDQSFPSEKIDWLNDLVRELEEKYDISQDDRMERIEVSPGTCDWILEKSVYKEFIASAQNKVLFIEGGPGCGKSAIAKFLSLELSKEKNPPACDAFLTANEGGFTTQSHIKTRNTIVAVYFSRKEGSDNSPRAILMHVLLQIFRAAPAPFLKAAVRMFSKFTLQRDLEFYWSLFSRVRRLLETNLFCVIDGLDECIRQSRSGRQTTLDQKMVGFLDQLCNISKEGNQQGKSCITKVVLTTRFEQEIASVTGEGSALLKILNSDISESVQQVIMEEVSKLFRQRDITKAAKEFIVEQITMTCGPVFQKGLTAVKILGETRSLDLANREAITSTLGNFNFEDYNDVYARVLERIHFQDQPLAAKIIRILFFTRSYLPIDCLQHALAVDKENPTVTDLERPPSKDSITNLISSSLGSLISTNGPFETLDLEHQSIYDFLRTLTSKKLQIFSCQDAKEGHLHLALICIRYLILWRHQPLSGEELASAGGDVVQAAYKKSFLLSYASKNWHIHVREAGELIISYHALVDRLLGIWSILGRNADGGADGGIDYYFAAKILQLQEQVGNKPEPDVPMPLHFLSAHGLSHVLSEYLRPQENQERKFHWRRLLRRSSNFDIPFDIDAQDYTGSTPLHHACINGWHETVVLLLNAGACGNIHNRDGYSPFAHAIQEGHFRIAELLMEEDEAYEGGETSRNTSCIHFASFCGMTSIVEALIENDTDPNSKAFDNWSPVHLAAQEGHMETLKVLLDNGGSADSCNSNGVTPLHSAAQKGHLEIIELLFKVKPDLDPTARTNAGSSVPGATPLYYAASHGHLKAFNFLKEKQGKVEPVESGDLPIHLAAAFGHLAIVSQFEDPMDIDAKGMDGRQPIHNAAISGHISVVKYLISKGPKVTPDTYGYLPIHLAAANGHISLVELLSSFDDINARSRTLTLPIHLAARNGHLECFKWLRSHGSEMTPDGEGIFPLHFAAEAGHAAIVNEFHGSDLVHKATNKGWLPIHLAAFQGHLEVAKGLKSLGADLDSRAQEPPAAMIDRENYQLTPLDIAVEHENEAFAMYLVDEGARTDRPYPFQQSLLHRAAMSGLKDLFLWLVQCGHDLLTRDQESSTPLTYAVSLKRLDIIKEYISMSVAKSIDIDTPNIFNMSPFMVALHQNELEIANLLLSAGANLHVRSINGVTILMLAVRLQDEALIKTVLDSGVEVNAREMTSQLTALHAAAAVGNKAACNLLIEYHADVNAQSEEGKTPLMEAASSFDVECVTLLLANGANPMLRDENGQTVLDQMKDHGPVWKLLQAWSQNYTPLSDVEQTTILRSRILHYISSLPDDIPYQKGLDFEFFSRRMFSLAHCFFALKDYERSRLCFEIRVPTMLGSRRCFDYQCEDCKEGCRFASFRICKFCPGAMGVCSDCFEKRSKDNVMIGCAIEHEFFEIGGEGWLLFKPGQINAEGRTVRDFISELRREFCKGK